MFSVEPIYDPERPARSARTERAVRRREQNKKKRLRLPRPGTVKGLLLPPVL